MGLGLRYFCTHPAYHYRRVAHVRNLAADLQLLLVPHGRHVVTTDIDLAIIAACSQAVRLPFMPDDLRVVDSTGALALTSVPKRMLILGGDMIGKTLHPHPTLGESIGMVAEVVHGSCTDAPPARK